MVDDALTVTVRAADVVHAPLLSQATAVNVCTPAVNPDNERL